MAKLPRTPDLARLRDTAPSFRVVGGIRLHRIYERGGTFPTLWNAFRHVGRHVGPLSRFDHHLGLGGDAAEPRGTLYAAADIPPRLRSSFKPPDRSQPLPPAAVAGLATARCWRALLATADRAIADYAADGHLRVIDATR